MGDFAIRALIAGNEVEGLAGVSKVALGIKCEGTPLGVASEVPGETGALAVTRSAVAGNQARAKIRIGHHALQEADARPVVSLLKLQVGKLQADGLSQFAPVVLGGVVEKGGVAGGEMLVGGFSSGGPGY